MIAPQPFFPARPSLLVPTGDFSLLHTDNSGMSFFNSAPHYELKSSMPNRRSPIKRTHALHARADRGTYPTNDGPELARPARRKV